MRRPPLAAIVCLVVLFGTALPVFGQVPPGTSPEGPVIAPGENPPEEEIPAEGEEVPPEEEVPVEEEQPAEEEVPSDVPEVISIPPRVTASSSVAPVRASSSVQVSSAAASSVRVAPPSNKPRPKMVRSSSSSSSSSFSSVVSSSSSWSSLSGSGTSFWDRENFGYSEPFFEEGLLATPGTWSDDAIPSNLWLTLLFTLVVGVTGLCFRSVASRFRSDVTLTQRLAPAALITIFLIELFELLVPTASAQAFDAAGGVSFLRLPFYAFLFFVVMGITDSFYGSLKNMPIKALNRWLKRVLGKEEIQKATWVLLLALLLYAVVTAHRNPQFSLLPSAQLGIIVVTALSLLVKTYSTDLFKLAMARRWKYPSWLEANLGGLVFAFVCVFLTRKFDLQPGFMYGLPIALYLLLQDSRRDAALQSFGVWWQLMVAAAVWLVTPLLTPYELLFDVFTTIPFILIEALFFDLLPIPSLTGGTLFKWNKLLWVIQFAVVTFLLFQVIFHPDQAVGGLMASPPTVFMLVGLACYAVGVAFLTVYVKLRKKAH